jgi:hypothetical protein
MREVSRREESRREKEREEKEGDGEQKHCIGFTFSSILPSSLSPCHLHSLPPCFSLSIYRVPRIIIALGMANKSIVWVASEPIIPEIYGFLKIRI